LFNSSSSVPDRDFGRVCSQQQSPEIRKRFDQPTVKIIPGILTLLGGSNREVEAASKLNSVELFGSYTLQVSPLSTGDDEIDQETRQGLRVAQLKTAALMDELDGAESYKPSALIPMPQVLLPKT
jgi:hypothetical protein